MFIEHEVRATIEAPIDEVWAVVGSFGDMSWNPGITAGTPIGDATPTVRSVREMLMPYGTPPFPVNRSRTTVTATPAHATPDSATTVTWHCPFDVPNDTTGRTVEHVNREIVWPALVAALASHLGVDRTIDASHPDENPELIMPTTPPFKEAADGEVH